MGAKIQKIIDMAMPAWPKVVFLSHFPIVFEINAKAISQKVWRFLRKKGGEKMGD